MFVYLLRYLSTKNNLNEELVFIFIVASKLKIESQNMNQKPIYTM